MLCFMYIFVVCFCRVMSWRFPSAIYFLVIQLLVVFVALVEIFGNRFRPTPWQDSCWGRLFSAVEHLGQSPMADLWGT